MGELITFECPGCRLQGHFSHGLSGPISTISYVVPRGHRDFGFKMGVISIGCPQGSRHSVDTSPREFVQFSKIRDGDISSMDIHDFLGKHEVATLDGKRPMILTSAEITPHDPERELRWWEDQYVAKLLDIGNADRGRPMPTPEDLRYVEDQILARGGSIANAREVARLKRIDQVVNGLIEEVSPNGPLSKAARAPRQITLDKTWSILSLAWIALAVLNFGQGNTDSGFIWLTVALLTLAAAVRRALRSR